MSHDHIESSPNTPIALSEIFAKYERGHREYLIPILQDVQDRFQYLSQANMEAVALHIGIPASKVFGVATFYNQFRLNPPGRHRIAVCRGTACHVIGSATVLEALEMETGIKAGSTSRDGCFSLEVVACLGACSMAPVIMINGEFHGRLTAKMVSKIVKDVRKKDMSGSQSEVATEAGGA